MSIQIGGQCKDCVNWEVNSLNDRIGLCRGWDCTLSLFETRIGYLDNMEPSDSVYATIRTHSTFGCVMFEARDKGEE